jgi:hypothetical protein
MPPYVSSDADVDRICAAIIETVTSVALPQGA